MISKSTVQISFRCLLVVCLAVCLALFGVVVPKTAYADSDAYQLNGLSEGNDKFLELNGEKVTIIPEDAVISDAFAGGFVVVNAYGLPLDPDIDTTLLPLAFYPGGSGGLTNEKVGLAYRYFDKEIDPVKWPNATSYTLPDYAGVSKYEVVECVKQLPDEPLYYTEEGENYPVYF